MGQVYDNWKQMVKEVKDGWLARCPRMLIVGELQDGLAFDSAYAAVTGKPLHAPLHPTICRPGPSQADLPHQEHTHSSAQTGADAPGGISRGP